jgi:hypothetical protein
MTKKEVQRYTPVILGDNAGPHQGGNYLLFMMHFCEQTGWKWEPQALQMPCVNNLDMCVFPMI